MMRERRIQLRPEVIILVEQKFASHSTDVRELPTNSTQVWAYQVGTETKVNRKKKEVRIHPNLTFIADLARLSSTLSLFLSCINPIELWTVDSRWQLHFLHLVSRQFAKTGLLNHLTSFDKFINGLRVLDELCIACCYPENILCLDNRFNKHQILDQVQNEQNEYYKDWPSIDLALLYRRRPRVDTLYHGRRRKLSIILLRLLFQPRQRRLHSAIGSLEVNQLPNQTIYR